MFIIVEKNVLFDPIQISLFSFDVILFQSKGIADSIEKVFWVLGSFLLILSSNSQYTRFPFYWFILSDSTAGAAGQTANQLVDKFISRIAEIAI